MWLIPYDQSGKNKYSLISSLNFHLGQQNNSAISWQKRQKVPPDIKNTTTLKKVRVTALS